MKITPRELMLAWATGLTVLLAAGYLFAEPRLKEMDRLRERMREAKNERALALRILDRAREYARRMEAVRRRLPNYSAARDVTAEYLRTLERLAAESDIKLQQRKPDREKAEGEDLYVLGLSCTWEGNLGAVKRFLLALKDQSVTMDIHELSFSVVAGGQGMLKGNFAINCAYTKNANAEAQNENGMPEPPQQ